MRAHSVDIRPRPAPTLAAAITIALGLSLCGWVEASEAAPKILVRVNGEPLFAEDLESVLGEIHRTQSVVERPEFDLDLLVFRVVNDALLAQEARSLEMHESPDLKRRLATKRESKARARLYREEILERRDFGEEAARKVYDEVYRTASLRIVSRRDRAELEELRARVLETRDDESFAALAREVSRDPYAPRGGVVETPSTNLFVSLYDYADSATPGELSEPLASQWGWTLVRVVKVEPADPALFEERRPRVMVELRDRQEGGLRAALVDRLRPQLGLEIDADVFESVGVRRMHDGRLVPQFEGPERIVARVAGRAITVEDLAGKLATAWSTLGNPTLALEWKPAALDDLIFEQLLVAEGLRRGYGDTPEVQRELHAFEMSQLASRYLKEVVATTIEVTPQEIREYYDGHRDQYRRPPRVHQMQLTVDTREEAERLAALARGGADFSWLVRRHSTDAYRDRGGKIGWAPANQGTPLFVREVARATAGEVFGPKEGVEGWVVLKVDLVEDQGHYEFEAVSGNVEEKLRGIKIVERIDTVIRRLRARAEIWTDAEAIAALRIEPAAPEEVPVMPGHQGH